MTKIKLHYVHEYRDRHGKLRRYVRRPGSRRVALPGLPGSPEFMQAYQDAMSGPVLRASAPKPGTLASLAAEYFGSAEPQVIVASDLSTDAWSHSQARRSSPRPGPSAGEGAQDH
jgi:hypothetical protein